MRRHQRGFIGAAVLLALLLLVIVFIAGSIIRTTSKKNTSGISSSSQNAPPTGLDGFNFLPKSFSTGDIAEFFSHVTEDKGAVTWAGDWQELGASSGGSHTVAKLAAKYDYEPVVIVTPFAEDGSFDKIRYLRPLSEENIQHYVRISADFCKKYGIRYFGIGIESNHINAARPDDFSTFIDLFNRAGKAVHDACPNAQVFTSLQLEQLRGLRGGLFGGSNNEAVNDWDSVAQYTEADFIAFSTYPGIVFKDPSEIPLDYYTVAAEKAGKPVAFSENGWSATMTVTGWESSAEEQARYARRFKELTKSLDTRFSIWSFLYDQDLPAPFQGIGLIDDNGTKRQAYDAWQGY